MSQILPTMAISLIMATASPAFPGNDIKSPDWDFNNPQLGSEWNRCGNLSHDNYSLTERNGFLRIKGNGRKLDQKSFGSIVARRKGNNDFKATTRLETKDGATAGLTLFLSPTRHIELCVVDNSIHLRSRIGNDRKDILTDSIAEGLVEIRVKGNDKKYMFQYSTDGNNFKEAGIIDTDFFAPQDPATDISIGIFSEGSGYADFDCFKYLEIMPEISPKLTCGHGNPLVDFNFTADPTAVEHEGRLYVYATNDHQQFDAVGRDGKNTYERIKSLVMLSTDDMVNWTYHGLIDVGKEAPWIMASWAPSVVSRKENDGKTHFYLYFSNSGFGTGVLTATSPVGPWYSPLDKSLVDANTPGLGKCKVPFDPGAMIDDNGTGWLTIGAGNSCIMRLGHDMISVGSEITEINAPHHFEANELNFINGTYVYTYNNDWQERKEWPTGEIPPLCSMCYMTSKTPLDPGSWQYRHHYLANPGDHGFDYSNNHTHLHKYNGNWYLFYHTLTLQKSFNTDGGFRNVCVDEIKVDENSIDISAGKQTLMGVRQIRDLNPFTLQQAETTAATHRIRFESTLIPGNTIAVPMDDGAFTVVRGARFARQPEEFFVTAAGKGVVEVRKASQSGTLIATVNIDSQVGKKHKARVVRQPGTTTCDLCFILKGEIQSFDSWQFK